MEEDNNPDNWHGFFYYNAADPRFMVPKRFGFGYTVNWAHWATKFLLAGLIILTALGTHNHVH